MWQKLFQSRWFLGILILIAIVVGRASLNVYSKYQESLASLAMAEKELMAIKNKQAMLQETTAKLKTEQGIEEAVRKKYQVTKDGEKLIIIIDEESEKLIETPEKPKGFWQTILGFFGFD